jgi:hypothetical protein
MSRRNVLDALERLLSEAVMSKFATAEECAAYRSAVKDCIQETILAPSRTFTSAEIKFCPDCEKDWQEAQPHSTRLNNE